MFELYIFKQKFGISTRRIIIYLKIQSKFRESFSVNSLVTELCDA